MTTDKIIGFRYLFNRAYQEKIHKLTNDIMRDSSEITLDEFKQSSIFSNAVRNLSIKMKNELDAKITDIAGNSINKNELKMIMYLLDANLEKVNNSEKFVMDSNFDVGEKSGIFQATATELEGLKVIPPVYDFDKGKVFPTIDSKDDIVTITDKEGNIIKREKVNK